MGGERVKIVASIAVAALALFAAYALVARPYADNLQKLELDTNTRGAIIAEPYRAALTARTNVITATRLLQRHPDDADLYIFLGRNQEVLEMDREAAETYARAIRVCPRSEIFLNLGLLQLKMGERSAAIETLARGVRFEPVLAEEIADPTVRAAVEARVAQMP